MIRIFACLFACLFACSLVYYFCDHNSMDDLIKQLSVYDDIPIFAHIIRAYEEEEHMPIPDYEYEIERLQKEIENLKRNVKPDQVTQVIMNIVYECQLHHDEEYMMSKILYYIIEHKIQNYEEYFARALVDPCIYESLLPYGYSTLIMEAFKKCSRARPRRYDVLAYIIDNITSNLIKEHSIGLTSKTYEDYMIDIGLYCSDYHCVRWLIDTYRISWDRLHVVPDIIGPNGSRHLPRYSNRYYDDMCIRLKANNLDYRL